MTIFKNTIRKQIIMKSSSWVIVNKETGESVFETFQESILPKLNTDKYEAIPAYDYLCKLNAKIKEE